MPTRVIGPVALVNALTTRLTVAAATQTILRHIHVQNNTAGAVTFTMSIGGADAAGTRIYDAYPIAANGILDVFCYYVLVAADIVTTTTTGAASALVLTVDGDVFTVG